MKKSLYIITMAKKILFSALFFQVEFAFSQFEPVNYDSGRNRVFEVMYKGPGGISTANKEVIFAKTDNLAQDLNLKEIADRFGAKTLIGKALLLYDLNKVMSPKDQSSIIKDRQKIIKTLIDNPELLEKFESLIQQAVEHEKVVMTFMKKRVVTTPGGNPLEYVSHMMNRSAIYQTYSQWLNAMGLVKYPSELTMQFASWQDGWKQTVPEMILSGLVGTFGLGYFFNNDLENKSDLASRQMILGAYAAARTAYGMYTNYIEALAVRDSLYSLNQLIDISQKIEELCREFRVEHQFKVSSIRSRAGVKLLDDLNIDRYKNKDTSFVLTPAIYPFMYEVYEQDDNLSPVYSSIAEIDVYVAIARKMTELQDADHKFCFTQFLDDQKTIIEAEDFWNMLVTKDDVVVNDISESRNIILTGPNEGGKTTVIRAILQNIVLSQTFGIAAASEFKLTPFDVINSYLNVSDDILHGRSRFASELKQAQDILTQIKKLGKDEKFFFAFDELFTGTNGEDGAECAYRFIDNIASYSGIQFIYATHFNRLKMIGTANPSCVNYKIEPPLRDKKGEFIRNEQGQLIYPYKLSLGANNVNVAMERAKDAGIFA